MATFKKKSGKISTCFEVSNIFTDEYMPRANPTYSLIYIYALRLCSGDSPSMEISSIAEHFKILESDVVKAFDYWEKQGLLVVNKNSGEDVFEFVDLSSRLPEKHSEKPPAYLPAEIALYSEKNKQVKELFVFAEQQLSKMLTSTELGILYSFYDFYHLPFEVIYMLISYCVSKGKSSLRYMEKVAMTWEKEGLTSLAAAEEYIAAVEEKASKAGRAKKALGIFDRKLSPTESKYLDCWQNTWKMPNELIEKAYDITVLKTGKLSFPYMNSILSSWHDKNISTTDEIKNDKKPTVFGGTKTDYTELDRFLRDKKMNSK